MSKWKLKWEQGYNEDYGFDRYVTTGEGEMVVEGSRPQIDAEIKKYMGAEVNSRESVSIISIEQAEDGAEAQSISSIGLLLDPYGTRR